MAKRKPITVKRMVSVDGGETYKPWEEYTAEEQTAIANCALATMANYLKEHAPHNPEIMDALYKIALEEKLKEEPK